MGGSGVIPDKGVDRSSNNRSGEYQNRVELKRLMRGRSFCEFEYNYWRHWGILYKDSTPQSRRKKLTSSRIARYVGAGHR
jgi:hypothetical protein